MSSDSNFTVASWFLGNVHVKPISTHSASAPPGPGSDGTDKNCPVSVVHFNDMNPGLLKCFAKRWMCI